MKYFKYLLLSFTAAIIFSGCSNDVDINASYKDIVVVYGLLESGENASDTTFLKINKAFLGDENALIMARIPDSSEFRKKLVVKMWPENNPADVITFDTISISNKDTGVFFNPYQVLYYSPFVPSIETKYHLQIIYNDMEITAEASTIENFRDSDISKPGFAKSIGFKYNVVNPVVWNRKDLAPRYNVTIRFHFKEIWEGQTDTVYRFIDWHKDTKKSTVGDDVESYYNGSTFYNALATYVPYPDADKESKVVSRFTGVTDFIIEAGGIELNTYMEVNEPSNSIIQDRPQYTNINNGVGIFSARTYAVKYKTLNDESKFIIKEDYYYLKFEY